MFQYVLNSNYRVKAETHAWTKDVFNHPLKDSNTSRSQNQIQDKANGVNNSLSLPRNIDSLDTVKSSDVVPLLLPQGKDNPAEISKNFNSRFSMQLSINLTSINNCKKTRIFFNVVF